MEQATTEYFKMYDLCLAGCEGLYEITEVKDFYPTLAGGLRTFHKREVGSVLSCVQIYRVRCSLWIQGLVTTTKKGKQ